MGIGNVNIWSKIRDPRSNNVHLAGSLTAVDADNLTPADIELSTIRAINLSPLNVLAGTQLTVAGSFGSGEANPRPGNVVDLNIIEHPEGSIGGSVAVPVPASGSHRISFDAVGW